MLHFQASQEVAEGSADNSQLLNLGKNMMAKINTAKAKPIPEQKPDAKKTVQSSNVKSPGKAILQALQVLEFFTPQILFYQFCVKTGEKWILLCPLKDLID